MTPEQKKSVRDVLIFAKSHEGVHVNHGDCIGADAEMHKICVSLRIPMTHYPCDILSQRAYLPGAIEVKSPRPSLQRNHDIVNNSDWIIAAPAEIEEVLRSGTWATIRYARKRGIPVMLVLPDGSTQPRLGE